jgi:hypothetical protein
MPIYPKKKTLGYISEVSDCFVGTGTKCNHPAPWCVLLPACFQDERAKKEATDVFVELTECARRACDCNCHIGYNALSICAAARRGFCTLWWRNERDQTHACGASSSCGGLHFEAQVSRIPTQQMLTISVSVHLQSLIESDNSLQAALCICLSSTHSTFHLYYTFQLFQLYKCTE